MLELEHMRRSMPLLAPPVCLGRHSDCPPPVSPPWVQETIFAGMGGPDHLFRSQHLEDRVALAAALHPVSVRLQAPGQPPPPPRAAGGAGGGGGQGQAGFVCLYQYDPETMMLGPLPQEALAS